MGDRPVEQLTLRQMFTEAERHSRELIDHLEKGFLPKAHSVLKLVRGRASDLSVHEVEDVTVYHSADQLLQSEQFTQQLFQRLDKLFAAIGVSVNNIVEGV